MRAFELGAITRSRGARRATWCPDRQYQDSKDRREEGVFSATMRVPPVGRRSATPVMKVIDDEDELDAILLDQVQV